MVNEAANHYKLVKAMKNGWDEVKITGAFECANVIGTTKKWIGYPLTVTEGRIVPREEVVGS